MSEWGGHYITGRPYAICDRCDRRKRLDELKVEWTGLKVCDRCHDPRPVHLSTPFINAREAAAIPGSRPDVSSAIADPTLAFDEASYTEVVDDSSVTLTITNPTYLTTYRLVIESSGGGSVSVTGYVDASPLLLAIPSIATLGSGTLTASYYENGELIATDTANLIASGDIPIMDFSDPDNSQYIPLVS